MNAIKPRFHSAALDLSGDALELVVARFRAMGDPLRLKILQRLESGDCNVSTLTFELGSTQSNISRHLKVLQDAGLVKRRQQGINAYYSIADEMVFELCEITCSRVRARLEAQVGSLKTGVSA
jgi:DNA-binding transcriptional ArsR family regulator